MDIGVVIGGGFRLVRQRPAAVAVWGLLYMLVIIGMSLLMRPFMRTQLQAMGGDPQAAFANVGAMIGQAVLFGLLAFILYVILFAASQRAVLQPDRPGFFYLRLGMDEARLLALSLLFTIGFYVAMLVLVLVMSLLIALLGAATGSIGLAATLAVVEFIGIFILAIWFAVRFALAFPLTLLRGKIVIGESWRITRGHFWSLFAAFLVLFLILMLLWAIVSTVTSAGYFAQLARGGLDPASMQQAAQQQMARQLGAITPLMVIGWILGGVVGGLSIAIWGGAIATAARELTYNPDEIAETFA